METKANILWVTDGTGWGWDIRANYISSILTKYNHHVINVRNSLREAIREAVEKVKPEIILIFVPSLISAVPENAHANVVLCLPGTRALLHVGDLCQ